MANIRTHLVGGRFLVAEFRGDAAKLPAVMLKNVSYHGQMLQTRVKANASGRPGPNAPTGDYRRSIGLRVVSRGGVVTAFVGTNKPQGRRLEYGFHGADSLGRVYNQPPYPHFGPAVDATAPGFFSDMAKVASLD